MVKWIYDVEDIAKVGFNTTEAVKTAVDWTKEGVKNLKVLDTSSATIKDILMKAFDCAGKEMSKRTTFIMTHEDKESAMRKDLEEINSNQDKLKTLNRYIFEKAVSPIGVGESRKIRELLSEEWAHPYISLVVHRIQEVVLIIEKETEIFKAVKNVWNCIK